MRVVVGFFGFGQLGGAPDTYPGVVAEVCEDDVVLVDTKVVGYVHVFARSAFVAACAFVADERAAREQWQTLRTKWSQAMRGTPSNVAWPLVEPGGAT